MPVTNRAFTPEEWAACVARPPVLAAALDPACSIRRWTDTPVAVSQPMLDHHYVAMHLGGPKRVTRRDADGRCIIADVADRSFTLVPAGTQFDWQTEGPIDYAHYYVTPARLARSVEEVFDKEGRSVQLRDAIGSADALLATLFAALMRDSQAPCGLYAETLNEAMIAQLVRDHSTLEVASAPRRHQLAPYRLRHVEQYIEANLGNPVTLDDLAAVARLSRYHFARSFAAAVGMAPYAYLEARRLARAKQLLHDGVDPIAVIARTCGFRRADHFSARFRRRFGISPRAYRAL